MILVRLVYQQCIDNVGRLTDVYAAIVPSVNDVLVKSVWNMFQICAIVVRKVVIYEREAIRKLCG